MESGYTELHITEGLYHLNSFLKECGGKRSPKKDSTQVLTLRGVANVIQELRYSRFLRFISPLRAS